MAAFVDRTIERHVHDILEEIRKKGGGTKNRSTVLTAWILRARRAGIDPAERNEVARRVNATQV